MLRVASLIVMALVGTLGFWLIPTDVRKNMKLAVDRNVEINVSHLQRIVR
jgi:hypothetical protein